MPRFTGGSVMDAPPTIREGQVLIGSLFNEPMRVEVVRTSGPETWIVGLVGTQSERFRSVTLAAADIARLAILDSVCTYDGDGRLLRLGLQAYSLGIAYEFDPYFGLSISRVDPLPHQLEEDVRRLRPDSETEAAAMRVVMDYEHAQNRQVHDVNEKNLGYDITSLDLNSGALRLIEVKGIGDVSGTVLLTPNERRVAEDRHDCYWLYVVTNCNAAPQLQSPIKDPARFPWHEVTKVQHYRLSVDAMTGPMQVREDDAPYGGRQ